MTEMQMARVLEQFATAYEKFRITPEVIKLWTGIFADYDAEIMDQAARRVIETCQYAPKPCDLKGALAAIRDANPKVKAYTCTPEEKRAYRAFLAAKGVHTLPDGQYALEKDVHGGETKIDFVLRVLGGEAVTRMLAEHLGGSIFNHDPQRYRDFLDRVLVPMAESDEANRFKF